LKLASGSAPLVNRSFDYDILGNIKTKSDVGTYNYPAANQARPHAVSSVTGTVEGLASPNYDYDANGNLFQVRSATGTPCAGTGPTPGERCLTYMSFNMPAGFVFLPQQQQCHALLGQLSLYGNEIRQRHCHRAPRGWIQPLKQCRLVKLGGQRPCQLRGAKPLKRVLNSGARDAAGRCNGSLRQMKLLFEPQNFQYLAHG
jgi:hypothetical protein